MIGQTISHYKVIEKIGQGGMGVVYKAEDTRLGRNVALKFLPEELQQDSTSRKRFLREAKSAAALDHPYICKIYEVGEEEGQSFISMEYIQGETLSQKLTEGPLPLKDALQTAVEIAEALEAAHKNDIVHRDLKPSNIMLTSDGHVKVMDFGLAKRVTPSEGQEEEITTALTRESSTLGTIPYMSPEQVRGEAVDARSDIFSFGVVLYEMLAGVHPFKKGGHMETAKAVLSDTAPPLTRYTEDIPLLLQHTVKKMLAKEPDRRYQLVHEVRTDLDELNVTSGESEVSATVAAATPAKRSYLWPVVAGGVMVLVILALAWLWPFTPAPAENAINSIAVLPFENLSPDPENEYFSEGMTEELVGKLSRIQNLQVASRTSAARFRGTNKDIKEIGEELGVQYVLEGSVRKAGDRVRITSQLVDASTGFQLWSDDFDGELKDVFVVQEETALKIAEALDLHLSPQDAENIHRRYTENSQAYDAYLRGWALVESSHLALDFPEEKLEATQKHFEEALALDPSYPLAVAGLAVVEVLYYYFNVDRSSDRLKRAKELAHQALTLDPQLPEAHLALAETYFFAGDNELALDAFRQALRLDPDNAYSWCGYSIACIRASDLEQAETAARTSIRLHPGYFQAYSQLGLALALQGRHEEAIPALEYALQLEPDQRSTRDRLGRVHFAQGNYSQALAQFEKVRQVRESPNLFVRISEAYAALGDRESALNELEKALAAGYRDSDAIDASPNFDLLRDDPRFQDLLRQMNLEP